MAKKAYIGVNNVARKTKKIYVGVNGVARKVKKGYIGVNGIARLFFSSGELKYYQSLSSTSGKGSTHGATLNNNYMIFVGPDKSGSSYNVTTRTGHCYDSSFTRTNKQVFNSNSSDATGTITGDSTYVYTMNNYSVNKINSSFTMTSYSLSSNIIGSGAAFVSNGTHLIIIPSHQYYSVGCYSCDTMTSTSLSTTFPAQDDVGSGLIGNYFIFAGGRTPSTEIATVLAVSSSLTKTNPTSLTSASRAPGAASNNINILFSGGYNSTNGVLKTTNVYNTSLTKSTGTDLSVGRAYTAGMHLGDYLLFSGGTTGAYVYDTSSAINAASKVTDIYDLNLVRTQNSNTNLTNARHYAGAATLNNYGMIYGGYTDIPEIYVID